MKLEKKIFIIIIILIFGVIGYQRITLPGKSDFTQPLSSGNNYKWDAEPVLVYVFNGPGYTGENFAWSVTPSFILYSDGHVFNIEYDYINGEYYRTYFYGRLNREQTCDFLIDIDDAGFLVYDQDEYEEPGVTDMGNTEISMRVWESNYISAYGLDWSSSNKLKRIYNTITEKNIPNKTEYIPDVLSLKIVSYDTNEAAVLWPFEEISISDLIQSSEGDEIIVEGDIAYKLFTFFNHRITIVFREENTSYYVTMKPVFPFEKSRADDNPWRDFPGFQEDPKTPMTCPPDDNFGFDLFELNNSPELNGEETTQSGDPVIVYPKKINSTELNITVDRIIGKRDGIGQLDSPWAITVNSKDQIIVGDTGNDRLLWFDLSGNFIKSVPIDNASIYDVYHGINDNLVVVDDWQKRIIVLSDQGEIIKTIENLPKYLSQFSFSAVAQGPDGTIYLSGYDAAIILKIPTAGDMEILDNSFFKEGIQALGVDGENNLYVLLRDCERLVKISSGNEIDILKFDGYIWNLQVFNNGDFVLYDESSDYFTYYNSNGEEIDKIKLATDYLRLDDFSISSNGEIVLLMDDYERDNVISVFDNQSNQIAGFGTTNDQPGQIRSHTTFSAGPDGDLWYVDFNPFEYPLGAQTLVHLGNEGEHLNTFTGIAGELLNCDNYIVEALPDNSVALADPCKGQIQIINGYGEVVQQWGNLGAQSGEFNLIDQLFFSEKLDSYLYVVDSGNNRITSFDLSGNLIVEWNTNDFGVKKPIDLFIHPDGTRYILDVDANHLVVLKTDTTIEYWKVPNDDHVNSIAVDPINNYVLIGGADSTIYIFDKSGKLLGEAYPYGSRGTLVDFGPFGKVYASTGYYRIYIYNIEN